MTPDNTMLAGVVDWFRGLGDRREYKRRSGAFHLWWQVNPADTKAMRPGVGTEISTGGLVFIIPDQICAREYTLVLAIRDRKVPVRVKTTRSDVVTHQGKTWHRYMAEFQGISADHWDAIVRYVNDAPEIEDRRKQDQEQQAARTDDAYRLLPLAIQTKIVQHLVRTHKLEEPKPGQIPLLKIFYGGIVKQAGKAPAHRFNVQSRIVRDGEAFNYETRFIINDAGEVTPE